MENQILFEALLNEVVSCKDNLVAGTKKRPQRTFGYNNFCPSNNRIMIT